MDKVSQELIAVLKEIAQELRLIRNTVESIDSKLTRDFARGI
ncbi:MAG: hypothetical protein ACETWE_05070 [Candidatus Bathyarchaeia archaeon]